MVVVFFSRRHCIRLQFSRGAGGLALLRELRARCITTPFILFTARNSPAIRDEEYRNGAFGVIRNTPFGKNTICRFIRNVYWAAMYGGNKKNAMRDN